MISPDYRFWVACERVTGDEHRSEIIDWDQRRWYSVFGSVSFLPREEEKEIGILQRYINELPPNVHTFTVDDNGALVSTDAGDDPTLIPYYPRYSDTPSLHDCSTIKLSDLTELDRIQPGVDLMSYVDGAATRKVAFKYTMIFQWIPQRWKEMHFVKSFQHPNLVPFDRVVVDDVESRVLGFTTPYYPGGTLDQNRDYVFRFEWLEQLTAVVDYLNLELGVVHQDVAPRNLLVDPETNEIRLFDFDRAAPISQAFESVNDVKGVIFTLYEIIAGDSLFPEVPYIEQDPDQVQSLEQWPVRCKLDSDLARYRKHLNDWVGRRKDARQVPAQVTDFGTPAVPPPSPHLQGYNETGEPMYRTDIARMRSDLLEQKKNFVNWERPPQQQTE